MEKNRSWTKRLTGACPCFSERLEEDEIEIKNKCFRADTCNVHQIWVLLQNEAVPPVQNAFTKALMNSGLFKRSEIISALCEVYSVGIGRSNTIWSNTTKKLTAQGLQCLSDSDTKLRFITNL